MKDNKKVAFCLGMHKSGTSWLYEQLFRHAEVHTLHRDSHFFSKDIEYKNGIQSFEKRCQSEILNIEFGNHYATSVKAIERIVKHYPNAKCLLIIRHPLNRIISHHKQNIKTGTYPPTTGLKEAIGLFPNMIEFSRLKEQIGILNGFVPKGNLCILRFDQISEEPGLLLNELQEFLKLDSQFSIEVGNLKVNKSRVPRSARVEQFQNALFYKLQQSEIGQLFWNALRKLKVGAIVRGLNTSQAQISIKSSEIDEMKNLLKEDIEYFETLA